MEEKITVFLKSSMLMYPILSVALLACGIEVAHAGNILTVSPVIAFTRFEGDLSFNAALGYGFLVAYHPDSEASFGLTGTITPTEEEFTLVTGVGHLHASVGAIRLLAEYRLLQLGNDFSVLASASVGVLHISTDEFRISLGALGQTIIAPRNETMALYGAGFVFNQRIAGTVALRLEPGASLYSHNGSSHSLLSIAGGISVGIL
jgi:hypothetical protein